MAKRVGVILSGLGHAGGSDAAETLLALLVLDRAGAEAVCAAPAEARADVTRLLPAGHADQAVRDLAGLDPRELDALLIPGGDGAVARATDRLVRGTLALAQDKAPRAPLPPPVVPAGEPKTNTKTASADNNREAARGVQRRQRQVSGRARGSA